MSGLPPGPPLAPLHLFAAAIDTPRFFQACAERYGDPFTVLLPAGKVVITGHPEGIREIFTADPSTFGTLTQIPLQPVLGEGSMLLLAGQRHKRERRLLMPPFHGDRMRAYGALMRDITLRLAGKLPRGGDFKAMDLTQAISLEVIIQAVFGVKEPERVAAFQDVIARYFEAYTIPLMFVPVLRRSFRGIAPWDRFQGVAATFNRMLDEEIAARRAAAAPGTHEDILSLLLSARDEEGQPMTADEIKDELRTMLIAGHETTAISMAWALYHVHRLPEVKERLFDELAALGPDPSPEALARLPYLGAVCDETLRLNPVVILVPRRLSVPMTLRGHALPAGIGVMAAIVLAHRDPGLFPEPERFLPERFLERKFSPFEYLPFGGGSRRCLGAAFALYEMKIALGSLLAAHRFSLAEEGPVRAVRRNVTFGPKTGVRLRYEGERVQAREAMRPSPESPESPESPDKRGAATEGLGPEQAA
ncbi:cytochrome P450 [Chondromyces apiculatus]|uniref:Cytochrome P450 n=1 Tax=Chondromyces apiculatus DSM 436 TaxID=1192034 RepID=A0A017T0Y0_9BACT|nr:cytochrome P450 [Chondromyces apiculatus]EYF02909.1 Cytochrome P450 [Chondromyces apiculatus DSM 436]